MKFRLVEAQVHNLLGKYKKYISDDFIKAAIKLDPTAHNNDAGKYSDWLLTQLLHDCIDSSGDVSIRKFDYYLQLYNDRNIKDYFAIFDQYGDIKSIKNIQQIKSIDDLFSYIDYLKTTDEYKQRVMQHEMRKLQKQASRDIVQVYEDSNFKVLVPNTYAASRAIAADTQWCTAGSDYGDQYFNKYRDESGDPNYFIIINKNDQSKKYQLHFGSKQFNNELNRPVDFQHFCTINPRLIAAILQYGVKTSEYIKLRASRIRQKANTAEASVAPSDLGGFSTTAVIVEYTKNNLNKLINYYLNKLNLTNEFKSDTELKSLFLNYINNNFGNELDLNTDEQTWQIVAFLTYKIWNIVHQLSYIYSQDMLMTIKQYFNNLDQFDYVVNSVEQRGNLYRRVYFKCHEKNSVSNEPDWLEDADIALSIFLDQTTNINSANQLKEEIKLFGHSSELATLLVSTEAQSNEFKNALFETLDSYFKVTS